MLRVRLLMVMGLVMQGIMAHAQTSGQPRVIGLGAYGAAVNDVRGFGWNAAGLTGIRDWDFYAASYSGTSSSTSGFVFHSLGLGRRFYETEAAALEFSPGSELNFVLPARLSVGEGNTPMSDERRFGYQDPLTAGYAHRFSTVLSAGVSIRYRTEEVTDTRISLVPGDTIALVPVTTQSTQEGREFAGDLALLWRPDERLTMGGVVRNLFWLSESALPDSLSQYALPHGAALEVSFGYRPFPSWVWTLGGSTNGTGAVGQEWLPGAGLAFRTAAYAGRGESPFVYAIGVSAGWSYEFLELEAAYQYHTGASAGKGNLTEGDVDVQRITSLDINPYGDNRVSFSIHAMFGNVRESMARIEGVELYRAVYPSSFEVFAYRPIGKARIRNISSRPIRARASFFVEKFMDAPTESQPVTIEPGAVQEIELTAVFNERMKTVTSETVSEGKVFVSATPAETYDDHRQVNVVIRGRNDWDGAVESLRFFVKPDDPDVLRATRDMLLQNSEALADISPAMASFLKARIIVNSFAGKLMYVHDPKLTADYVQYPAETLRLRGGDCDDMSVCFSSLLSSVGISTAFVDVVPPKAPENSHIYLLFDTGLDPRYGSSISENPKRYVVRRNKVGAESIWIPLETTVVGKGFDQSWASGAQNYFDDVEVGLGLAKGWVRIVDVN
jgi:hypothetical protein